MVLFNPTRPASGQPRQTTGLLDPLVVQSRPVTHQMATLLKKAGLLSGYVNNLAPVRALESYIHVLVPAQPMQHSQPCSMIRTLA